MKKEALIGHILIIDVRKDENLKNVQCEMCGKKIKELAIPDQQGLWNHPKCINMDRHPVVRTAKYMSEQEEIPKYYQEFLDSVEIK